MSAAENLVYQYDGTFDGLLCCVFESYEKKEIPIDILLPETAQTVLLPIKRIETDLEKAKRVLVSIPKKMGQEAFHFVKRAFLTYYGQKEVYILLFLRLGYSYGFKVMELLSHDVVHTLFKAVRHLERETHLFKGFIRFSDFQHVLVAQIEPKNYVLPLLLPHFRDRYPEERFLIHDKTHKMALIYQPYQSLVVPLDEIELPQPDQAEQKFRTLWQVFYNTIEIKERHNPKCRMTLMPKRYWTYMTELSNAKETTAVPSIAAEKNLLK
ncbi:TIGR03915 family putative DNA repair protein [Anaerosinus massiliensis]|uniref:TIGR03915 family putative DNA repair protein n=1 Tax=Massilibacillus massiliensis TaxID=1806837 RepID=UPI000A560D7D|nr:TIGR03915 family putative DNA repair protein [Massilibacillus massiliensis]